MHANKDALSDSELLSRIKSGDHTAFRTVYERYSEGLYYSAYNLLRDKTACEDLVQDLFLKLWLKRRSLHIVSLRAYLYTAIRNNVLMLIRAGKASLHPHALGILSMYDTPEDIFIEKEIQWSLDENMQALPQRCREIFHLSRKEHLSNKEIATRLNISPKTVENQITIALRHLRISMGDFFALLALALFW